MDNLQNLIREKKTFSKFNVKHYSLGFRFSTAERQLMLAFVRQLDITLKKKFLDLLIQTNVSNKQGA